LSHIVSGGEGNSNKDGKVFAFELLPELERFGRVNVAKYNFIKGGVTVFHCRNAVNGMPEEAPFDRIISAASGERVPPAWKKQLKGLVVASRLRPLSAKPCTMKLQVGNSG